MADFNYDPARASKRLSFPPSASASAGQFTLDEGFAESSADSQSHENSGNSSFADMAANFQLWLGSQSKEQRSAIALEILKTLPPSQISAIVDKLTPLLHMNPVELLPPEVTFEIFSHLDASTLLTACLASHTWRERILDPRLWQQLYKTEGWAADMKEVKSFEESQAALIRSEFKKAKGRARVSFGKGQPLMKRRATSDWLDSTTRKVSADVSQWREQHGVVEADTDATEIGDQEMQDVSNLSQTSPQRPNKRQSQDSGDEMDYTKESLINQMDPSDTRLVVEDGQGDIKLNWPYLYKQRHRLEMNWKEGKYTNFQLPHPGYPQEAHTECVYTIQFYGKWLVSGSRDKTLRIWDLESRRLRGKPLSGHSQSVLCLQFDPTEDEDVIISGSSDSSVIVWRFSTGQKLHVVPSAHEESVLNLRFDKRYLVTCSKDKKIKIWSRAALTPLDKDYPKSGTSSGARFPSYIIDTTTTDPSLLEAKLANGQIKPLKAYSLLLTLEGHAAAVNAIQINGDLIVSASGDRLIRVWDVKTGQCLRVLPGHQKGIACVQFDSKRIVSGSSDNSVRIYDLITGAEVAVLTGHTNLVRTVQAGFGDPPGSEHEDMMKARQAELEYARSLESGAIVEDRHYMRRVRHGEVGSSRPAIGSKLPPGGGGGRWGRIVSGSYDESIIIWKQDAHGNWTIGQTLRQEAALRTNLENDRLRMAQQGALPNEAGRRWRGNSSINMSSNVANGPVMSASQIVQHAMSASMTGLQNGIQNVMGLSRGLTGTWNVPPRPGNASNSDGATNPADVASLVGPVVQSTNQAAGHAPVVSQNTPVQPVVSGGQGHQASHSISSVHGSAQSPANSSVVAQVGSNTGTQSQPASQAGAPVSSMHTQTTTDPHQPQAPSTPAQQAQPALQPVNQAHQQHLGNIHGNLQPTQQSVSRVFKLQFDARRIVCCSQDSRIIGWDFAYGDPEIEAASKFFVGP